MQFQHVHSSTLRESVAKSELPEAIYGMLKKESDQLGWGTKEKTILLDMATDTYIAKTPVAEVEVIIRSLCHSRVVTADYVERGERFNTKRSVLIIGQLGEATNAWTELVQPALYLFATGCNIIWVEIPGFVTNSTKWIRYGPSILKGALKELQVNSVKVFASGVGGSIFLETLRLFPKLFAKTHVLYNFDLPRYSKALPFPIEDVEELLRTSELQLWFAYNDEADVFDRSSFGTAMKAFDAVLRLQARLEGERKRGHRQLDYDEVIVSEALNNRVARNVTRVPVARNENLLAFSEAFMRAVCLYFELPPQTYQEDLEHGLPPQSTVKKKFRPNLSLPKGPDGEHPELPAMRRLRLGPPPEQRPAIADGNRRRLERVANATLCLAAPNVQQALPAAPELSVRMSGSLSTPSLRDLGTAVSSTHSRPSLKNSGSFQKLALSLAAQLPPSGQSSGRASPKALLARGGTEEDQSPRNSRTSKLSRNSRTSRTSSLLESEEFLVEPMVSKQFSITRGERASDKYNSMWKALHS